MFKKKKRVVYAVWVGNGMGYKTFEGVVVKETDSRYKVCLGWFTYEWVKKSECEDVTQ